jgi:MerR family transcriptional regulator, light-induced transcriptional regulator
MIFVKLFLRQTLTTLLQGGIILSMERTKKLLPVRAVVSRTGVSAHLLRAWERRYQAVVPLRSDGGQRLYSEEDVERLRLLREAAAAGHSIGGIARLPEEELRGLVRGAVRSAVAAGGAADDEVLRPYLEAALVALEQRDATGLKWLVARASVVLGQGAFIEGLLVPFLREVGARWEMGLIGPGDEHVVSQGLRSTLGSMLATLEAGPSAPVVLCGTPAGQRHEFGALLAGVAAAEAGWRVIYLGPDLPAEEIVRLAGRSGARAVALSVLRPAAEPDPMSELARIRELLPVGVPMYVGGPLASGEIPGGVVWLESVSALTHELRSGHPGEVA